MGKMSKSDFGFENSESEPIESNCRFDHLSAKHFRFEDSAPEPIQRSAFATPFRIRKLMALCYVPATHIRPLFRALIEETNSPALKMLVCYMKSTWIDSSIFKPENWSVFGLPFRTNNDVEGWHHRMNKKTKPNTPFYLLVQVFNAEAREIPINIELLSLLKFK